MFKIYLELRQDWIFTWALQGNTTVETGAIKAGEIELDLTVV